MKSTYNHRSLIVLFLIVGLVSQIPMVTASGENWLSSYDYRRLVTITGAAGAGTGYQVKVNVTYDAHMQSGFGDLRFTDNDGDTELNYWIQEQVNSSYAVCWVQVADDLSAGGSIYLYYGNDAVSTTSNGYTTFEWFEDWYLASVNVTRWDTDDGGGSMTFSTTDANHGYVARLQGGIANGAQSYSSVDAFDYGYAAMFRAKIEAGSAFAQRIRIGYVLKTIVQSTDGTNKVSFFDDSVNEDSQAMDGAYFDSWYTFEIQRNGSYGRLYANTTHIETGDMTPDTNSDEFYIYCRDEEKDLYTDWIAIRKFVEPMGGGGEPIATVGAEELEAYWEAIGEETILLDIPLHMWGINVALILLGLAMIPASTFYLVYGGRDRINRDKVLLFLIVFLVGWGLLIGGIMP